MCESVFRVHSMMVPKKQLSIRSVLTRSGRGRHWAEVPFGIPITMLIEENRWSNCHRSPIIPKIELSRHRRGLLTDRGGAACVCSMSFVCCCVVPAKSPLRSIRSDLVSAEASSLLSHSSVIVWTVVLLFVHFVWTNSLSVLPRHFVAQHRTWSVPHTHTHTHTHTSRAAFQLTVSRNQSFCR